MQTILFSAPFPIRPLARRSAKLVLAVLLLTFGSPFVVGSGGAHAAAPAVQPPGAAAALPAPAVSIYPHKATYRLDLDSTKNTSQVRGASGRMTSIWRDACQGWTMEQALTVNFTYDEQDENALTSTFTTWESKDGTQYRFTYRRSNNGLLAEELRGVGKLDRPGGKGEAVFTVPEVKKVPLPEGSYFPTSHTLMLIREALQKTPRMMSATIFDGSDAEGISEVSAILGAGRAPRTELGKATLPEAQRMLAWPLRMAFFPLGKEASEPEYEMDTNLLPNGVSEFMLMDYGDFKLRGTLEKLEPLPKPTC